jgi:hypothetical protein
MSGQTCGQANRLVLLVLVRLALRLCPPVEERELVRMLLDDALGVLKDTGSVQAEVIT